MEWHAVLVERPYFDSEESGREEETCVCSLKSLFPKDGMLYQPVLVERPFEPIGHDDGFGVMPDTLSHVMFFVLSVCLLLAAAGDDDRRRRRRGRSCGNSSGNGNNGKRLADGTHSQLGAFVTSDLHVYIHGFHAGKAFLGSNGDAVNDRPIVDCPALHLA